MLSLGDQTGDGVVVPRMQFNINLSGNTCTATGQVQPLSGGAVANMAGGTPLASTPVCPVGAITYWAIQCDGSGNLTAQVSTSAPPVAAAGAALIYQDVLQTTDPGLDKDPGPTLG